MATSITKRRKILGAIIALALLAALAVGAYVLFSQDSPAESKDPKGGTTSSHQQNDVPPLTTTRAAKLEELLSSSNPQQYAAAWSELMRDDVIASVPGQETYKLQLDTFNNKDDSGKKSVSGAVSATAGGEPCIISLVYIEDDTTAKPDGTWFVWGIR